MAWSNSKIFRAHIGDMMTNVAAFDLDTDSIKIALYNNTTTPDQNATAANSAFNASTWTTTNEVSQAVQWPTGGVALTSKVVDVATNGVAMFDAADTASGSAATLSGVFGSFAYEDTLTTPVADQGICYNYFGGTQSVTSGTFTIQWSANGIYRWTF